MIEKGRDVVLAALESGKGGFISRRRSDFDRSFVDTKVKDSLSRFFYERIHRRPVIIPVVVEVKR